MGVKLAPWRYDEIEKDVVEFLQDYGATRFPLDVFSICHTLGIIVIPYFVLDDEGTCAAQAASNDAFTLREGYKFVIAYNQDIGAKRIRFSIAHELAHIVLDHFEGTAEEESEANWFAAYMLAPLPLIIRYKINSTSKIIDTFDVGFDCANYILIHANNRFFSGKTWKEHEEIVYEICDFAREEVVTLDAAIAN